MSSLVRASAPLWLAAVMFGCSPSAVGDPCVPESTPEGGYDSREIYLESGSVQCRTRACMVYLLDGNPDELCETPGADPETCANREAVEDQIFCTCRCSASDESQANAPLCNCGDGFTCVDDLVTAGGPGVQGGYCVPCIEDENPRGLDATVFDPCPTD